MRSHLVLPVMLLVFAFVAFTVTAMAFSDANDLAGVYSLVLGGVAIRAAMELSKVPA